MEKVRNIGILAHANAGKTTLTEYLLYLSGAIRQPGSVDSGTTHTDTMDLERQRGISIRSADMDYSWEGTHIHLIDTPGHADFASEVERSLWALDGAVLVVSCAEGVQAQTEIYAKALLKAGLPFLLFLNKVDRLGADSESTLLQCKEVLTPDIVPLWNEEEVLEAVAQQSEEALSRYLEGDLSLEEARTTLFKQSQEGKVHLALRGAAKNAEGVREVLSAIVQALPDPPKGNDALCGIIYGVENGESMGRGAKIRLFSGKLQNRQTLTMQEETNKISQIRIQKNGRWQDAGEVQAGEIALVYGLGNVHAGQILGMESLLPPGRMQNRFATPLLSSKVFPKEEKDMPALKNALEELASEDPTLQVKWEPLMRELSVRLMGSMQIQILSRILEDRFSLKAEFGPMNVIYLETPAKAGYGQVHYTMPKPCWACMDFAIEPLPRGSGVTFDSSVLPETIGYRYQNQVRKTIPRALEQGRMGWEVTDIAIHLIGGSDHVYHTHPLDFVLATPWGIQDALQNTGTLLLEPMLQCRITLPQDSMGKVLTHLNTLRAELDAPVVHKESVTLSCFLPVAGSMDFPTDLAAMTGGKGALVSSFSHYQKVDPALGKTSPRRGVDPLDTARYILAARKALESEIW